MLLLALNVLGPRTPETIFCLVMTLTFDFLTSKSQQYPQLHQNYEFGRPKILPSDVCNRVFINFRDKQTDTQTDLKTHVQNLRYHLPYNSGAPKPPFWTTSQLNGKFNGLYLGNETRHRQSVKCVNNYEGFPTSSQNVMNFGPQTASNPTCILPTLRKFYIPLHCQASQTEISKRNSTKLCQTVDGRSRSR